MPANSLSHEDRRAEPSIASPITKVGNACTQTAFTDMRISCTYTSLSRPSRGGILHSRILTRAVDGQPMRGKNRASSKKKASSGQASALKRRASTKKKACIARRSSRGVPNKEALLSKMKKMPLNQFTFKNRQIFCALSEDILSTPKTQLEERDHDPVDAAMKEDEEEDEDEDEDEAHSLVEEPADSPSTAPVLDEIIDSPPTSAAASGKDVVVKTESHPADAPRPSSVLKVEGGSRSKAGVEKKEKIKKEKHDVDAVSAAEEKRIEDEQAAADEAKRAEEESKAAADAARRAKEKRVAAAKVLEASEKEEARMAAVAQEKRKAAADAAKKKAEAAKKSDKRVCIDLTTPPPSPRQQSAPSVSPGASDSFSPELMSSSSSPSSSSSSSSSSVSDKAKAGEVGARARSGGRSDAAAGGASSSNQQQHPQYRIIRNEPPPPQQQQQQQQQRAEKVSKPRPGRGGNRWTDDEVMALREGVERHGEGSWKSIIKDPRLNYRFDESRRESNPSNQVGPMHRILTILGLGSLDNNGRRHERPCHTHGAMNLTQVSILPISLYIFSPS